MGAGAAEPRAGSGCGQGSVQAAGGGPGREPCPRGRDADSNPAPLCSWSRIAMKFPEGCGFEKPPAVFAPGGEGKGTAPEPPLSKAHGGRWKPNPSWFRFSLRPRLQLVRSSHGGARRGLPAALPPPGTNLPQRPGGASLGPLQEGPRGEPAAATPAGRKLGGGRKKQSPNMARPFILTLFTAIHSSLSSSCKHLCKLSICLQERA